MSGRYYSDKGYNRPYDNQRNKGHPYSKKKGNRGDQHQGGYYQDDLDKSLSVIVSEKGRKVYYGYTQQNEYAPRKRQTKGIEKQQPQQRECHYNTELEDESSGAVRDEGVNQFKKPRFIEKIVITTEPNQSNTRLERSVQRILVRTTPRNTKDKNQAPREIKKGEDKKENNKQDDDDFEEQIDVDEMEDERHK